ncbi:atrophin-1-like isoform X1 [Lates japonicus]|uniref:Atrophin-1-like isoform X1 n=1 Tax=Lates japonicus TaxID=270547 RepID=A0AAD3NP02_LATJO|nr:atrophin-1-like isoform X1 [Lates japonicus]
MTKICPCAVGDGGGRVRREGVRRPHSSPTRPERNDRQTQRGAGEELAGNRFSRRSQGHDSSESEGEELMSPPKRQKVQDSASTPNPPTSTHSTDSSAPSVPPPTSVARQSPWTLIPMGPTHQSKERGNGRKARKEEQGRWQEKIGEQCERGEGRSPVEMEKSGMWIQELKIVVL